MKLAQEGLQVVLKKWDFKLFVDNVNDLNTSEIDTYIRQKINQEALTPFDLAHDLMLRACLIELKHEEWALTITLHQMVFQ